MTPKEIAESILASESDSEISQSWQELELAKAYLELIKKHDELKEDVKEDRVKPDDYLYLATVNKALETENKKMAEQLESANAEIASYEKHLKLFEESIRHSFKKREDKLKSENKKLSEANTKLRAALEHISSPKHWAIDTFVPEIRDRVKIAREALEP